jgi:hypothetical protein
MMDLIAHSASLLYLRRRENKSPPVASYMMTYLPVRQLLETSTWVNRYTAYIVCCVSNAALIGRIFG